MSLVTRITPQENANLFFACQGALESGLRKNGVSEAQIRDIVDRLCAVEITRAVNPLTQEERPQKIRLELEGHGQLRAITFTLDDNGKCINTRIEKEPTIKTITKDDPEFDDLFAAVISIMQDNGAKIDNIEALKRDVDSIIYMEGQINLKFCNSPKVEGSRILGA
jgi:hypothetical protein|nr:hypothetical protein [uncultured Cardiobacterium sp.]